MPERSIPGRMRSLWYDGKFSGRTTEMFNNPIGDPLWKSGRSEVSTQLWRVMNLIERGLVAKGFRW